MIKVQSKSKEFKLDSDSRVWDEEYNNFQAIPSSTRNIPSKALVLFSELLNFQTKRKVLDAGCGIGRNAIYLAQKGCEVHAVDSSKTALCQLDHFSKIAGVRNRIISYDAALDKVFPFKDNSFDLVLDSYVFCHFIDDRLKSHYKSELHRVTKPKSIVFSSLFSTDDNYYKELIDNGHGNGDIVVDPNNGVTKQLYTETTIKEFFASHFNLLYFVKFRFTDIVLSKPYERSILILILQK
jgi:SAM-dependent methyltransferase